MKRTAASRRKLKTCRCRLIAVQGYMVEDWYSCPQHSAPVKDRLWLNVIRRIIRWYEKEPRRSVESLAYIIIKIIRTHDAKMDAKRRKAKKK